jgi:hypothetical protein
MILTSKTSMEVRAAKGRSWTSSDARSLVPRTANKPPEDQDGGGGPEAGAAGEVLRDGGIDDALVTVGDLEHPQAPEMVGAGQQGALDFGAAAGKGA